MARSARGPPQQRQQGVLFDLFAKPSGIDRYLRIPAVHSSSSHGSYPQKQSRPRNRLGFDPKLTLARGSAVR